MVANFTPAFNVTEQVHYNVSYIIANQPPQMTTSTVYIVFGLVGIGLLLLSVMNIAPTCNDLSGVMAALFFVISAIQSFAVDTVTGFGVTGIINPGNVNEFVLMENHTIYHYDFWGVAFGILFIIALANLYRLALNPDKVTDQQRPTLDSGDTGGQQRQAPGKKKGLEDEEQ
jgi:tellurite resistance protein TehA-like permease